MLPDDPKLGYSAMRFLWDEQLSHQVPRALRVLGLNTTHVGNEADGAPARGSSDLDIIDFAAQTKQIIVTSNHDMMLLCAEASQRFVWLDPRGKQLSRVEQTLLVFRQIHRWDSILSGGSDACVRSMRTKCESISPLEAARLTGQRMRSLQKRHRVKKKTPLGPLVEDDD